MGKKMDKNISWNFTLNGSIHCSGFGKSKMRYEIGMKVKGKKQLTKQTITNWRIVRHIFAFLSSASLYVWAENFDIRHPIEMFNESLFSNILIRRSIYKTIFTWITRSITYDCQQFAAFDPSFARWDVDERQKWCKLSTIAKHRSK